MTNRGIWNGNAGLRSGVWTPFLTVVRHVSKWILLRPDLTSCAEMS